MAKTFANVAASAVDTNIVTAVAGKKVRVLAIGVSCGASASTVTFNSKSGGAGTAISATFNNSIVLPFDSTGHFITLAGEGLSVSTGAGSTTGIQIDYDFVAP